MKTRTFSWSRFFLLMILPMLGFVLFMNIPHFDGNIFHFLGLVLFMSFFGLIIASPALITFAWIVEWQFKKNSFKTLVDFCFFSASIGTAIFIIVLTLNSNTSIEFGWSILGMFTLHYLVTSTLYYRHYQRGTSN